MSRQLFFRSGIGLAVSLVVAIAATRVSAQEAAVDDGRFSIEITSCPKVAPESVRRILVIEVGDLVLPETDSAPARADLLTIRCAGDLAWLVASGTTGAPVEQTLRLDELPGDATPRALALAGLELLATRSSIVRERIANAHSRAPLPAASVPSVEVRREPPMTKHETRLGVAGAWRTFLVSRGASTWGGQLQAASAFGARWQVVADAEAAGGKTQMGSLGEVGALTLSGAASAGLRFGTAKLGASLGAGGRFGAVRLSGTSSVPANAAGVTVWRPWGGPLLSAGVSAEFGRLVATAGAELGRSVLEPEGRAGGTTAISMRGTWASLSVGVSIRP